MRIIVRRAGHRPDFTLLLRQLFTWMKRRSRNGLTNFNLLHALTLTQLSQFLGALTPPRTVTSCTASDIVNFLIFKDKSGRTVVHSSLCSRASCTCPKRSAAGSVASLIGRLRAVFNNLGRLNDSNPVAHPLVKDYLKFVRQEQAGLAITPVHAVPLFFDKFRRLIAFLRGLLLSHMPLSRSGKYILVRLCLTACRLDLLSPSINYAAP